MRGTTTEAKQLHQTLAVQHLVPLGITTCAQILGACSMGSEAAREGAVEGAILGVTREVILLHR